MALDPVCQAEVSEENPPGGKARYRGQSYSFCTVACRAQFQRQPQKFVQGQVTAGEAAYDPRMFMGDM